MIPLIQSTLQPIDGPYVVLGESFSEPLTKQRCSFCPEFKQEAACRDLVQSYSHSEASRSVRVAESVLRRRVQQLQTERQGIAPQGKVMTADQQRIQELETGKRRSRVLVLTDGSKRSRYAGTPSTNTSSKRVFSRLLRRTGSHTQVQLNRLPQARHLSRPSNSLYGLLAEHSGQRFIVGPE